MSNTEKRNQRINLVLSPSIKSGLTKIAAIKQISTSSHNSKNLSSTQELNSCIIPPHAHR